MVRLCRLVPLLVLLLSVNACGRSLGLQHDERRTDDDDTSVGDDDDTSAAADDDDTTVADDDDTTAGDDDDTTVADDDDTTAGDDDDTTAGDDDTTAGDDDTTAGDDDDTTAGDDDDMVDPLAGLSRGMRWVRSNPMFVSGLVVSMQAPSPSIVEEYFDDFGATAVHTWGRGLPNRVQGWQAAGHNDFSFLSWVGDDGTSHDGGLVIGGIAPDMSGRIGYQVGDEPRNMADLQAIEQGVDAVRIADPDALVVVNFGNPEQGTDLMDLLDYTATSMDVDVISYDWYGYDYSTTYERLAIHRQIALDHGMPYWRYLSSYQDLGASDWPEESDMRWNVMSGVVYGYTGHTWFVYQSAAPPHQVVTSLFDQPGTWSSPANQRFSIASELNAELAVLGEVLPWLTSTEVRYTPGVSLYSPSGTSPWSPGAGGDPYLASVEPVGGSPWEVQDLLIGFFVDDSGSHYVALQNPTHASADWPVMVSGSCSFELRFDFSSAPPGFDSSALMVLDHHQDSTYSLPLSAIAGQQGATVTLDAGDLVFFKYADGVPFAGRPAP
jgi:hypothetical protein